MIFLKGFFKKKFDIKLKYFLILQISITVERKMFKSLRVVL